MSADFILMEGIRMVDEWPIIEKKIPSMDIVFRPVVDPSMIEVGGAGGRGGRRATQARARPAPPTRSASPPKRSGSTARSTGPGRCRRSSTPRGSASSRSAAPCSTSSTATSSPPWAAGTTAERREAESEDDIASATPGLRRDGARGPRWPRPGSSPSGRTPFAVTGPRAPAAGARTTCACSRRSAWRGSQRLDRGVAAYRLCCKGAPAADARGPRGRGPRRPQLPPRSLGAGPTTTRLSANGYLLSARRRRRQDGAGTASSSGSLALREALSRPRRRWRSSASSRLPSSRAWSRRGRDRRQLRRRAPRASGPGGAGGARSAPARGGHRGRPHLRSASRARAAPRARAPPPHDPGRRRPSVLGRASGVDRLAVLPFTPTPGRPARRRVRAATSSRDALGRTRWWWARTSASAAARAGDVADAAPARERASASR